MSRKVYVVVSDVGLNGPIIHGVYTTPPTDEEVEKLVMTGWVSGRGFHFRVGGLTGYQNTTVEEVEVDAPMRPNGWSASWGDE